MPAELQVQRVYVLRRIYQVFADMIWHVGGGLPFVPAQGVGRGMRKVGGACSSNCFGVHFMPWRAPTLFVSPCGVGKTVSMME